jgi:predicted MFS family arabinose efflux permease
MSGVPVGLILGIPLGRMMAVGYGFRTPFVAFAVVMAAAYLFIQFGVPQPDVERAAHRPTVAGSLRQYAALLRAPDTAAAAAIYFVMYLGLGLLVVYLPQWLTEQFPLEVAFFGRPLAVAGMPVDFIASLFFAGGVASVLVGPQAGRLSDRLGRKPLILASCVGLAVVTFALPYAVTERWVAYPLYIAIMGLFAMRMAPLQALLTALVPGQQRGAFLSLTIALGQIGTGLGATLGGALYGRWGYPSNTVASTGFMVLMAVLVWRFLPEPTADAAGPVAVAR